MLAAYDSPVASLAVPIAVLIWPIGRVLYLGTLAAVRLTGPPKWELPFLAT
jgi:hypothetical protein